MTFLEALTVLVCIAALALQAYAMWKFSQMRKTTGD